MQSILLVGAGKMGGAMLRGWYSRLEQSTKFVILDPNTGAELAKLSDTAENRVSHCKDVLNLPTDYVPDVIVLATKPQLVQATVETLRPHIGTKTILISVAAGISSDAIKAATIDGIAVVRVMPNIGALVGHSVSAAFACADTSDHQKAWVKVLFEAIGEMTWLSDEENLHLATAVSGSGPAYYFAFCEAMITAAQESGLAPNVARQLAIGTIIAAGRLLESTPDPTNLREMVTSPNGTTAAGLDALTANKKIDLIARNTVDAAAKRARELG